jgi:ribosomal protein L16 Arg81 hydroxylase
MGRAGTITHLHKDIPDNFSFAYFGRKRWILYPPRDYPYLYMVNPHEKEVPDFGASQVNLKSPDYEKFPDFAKAHPVEFIQEAGDMLYLPAGWSHYVENLEDTLMLNFWLLREKSPAVLGNDN